MIQWLQNYWQDLVSEYTDDAMVNLLWKDIKSHYTSKDRNYHNLSHLYNMFLQLEDIKTEIEDLDSLKFAIWYHDIIYKSTNKDNEEQSANFVEKVLKLLHFDDSRVKKIRKLILSTKKHKLLSVENNDNAYLLDLDLSILGTDWETYQLYTQSIKM